MSKKLNQKTIWILSQEGKHVIAQHVESDAKKVFKPTDRKYEKVLEYFKNGKLLSISPKGRMQGRKDYEGYLSKNGSVNSKNSQQYKKVDPEEVKPELTRLDNINFSPDLFVPMPTYTPVDKILSTEGGFLPGSNVMCAGAPGSGKTTVLLELIYAVQQNNPNKKVLFISAEMNKLDVARYQKRFPHWGQIPMLFMEDFHEGYVKEGLMATLNEGWDIVLTDSYTEINDTIKEDSNMTSKKTEKWFLDLMEYHNMANNGLQKHTTFLTILQLSKGGNFVGSNKLKHLTTGMMHMNWEGSENNSARYMKFSKNRLGNVDRPLYFTINGNVHYDDDRFERERENEEAIEKEKEKLKEEETAFDSIFENDEQEQGENVVNNEELVSQNQ